MISNINKTSLSLDLKKGRNKKSINKQQNFDNPAVERLAFNDIPSFAIKAGYCPSFGKFKKIGNINLIDKSTGEDVNACIKKENIGDFISFKIFKGKKEAGFLDMDFDSLFPECDYIKNVKDNAIPEIVHIRSLMGDKYAGIGTALINAAVDESSKRGKQGCLWLKAEKGYANMLSPYRSNQNPIPFYYKLGFKSVNPKTDKFITECINNSKYDKLPDSVILLLPEESITAKNKYFANHFSCY